MSVYTRCDAEDARRAQAIECPVCKAQPGENCNGAMRLQEVHIARLIAARPDEQNQARRALIKQRARKARK